MKYKKYDCDSYTIHTIATDRFRNCHLEIIFRDNIKKEDITKRIMLTDLMALTSLDYPSKREMDIELENLYNSSFYAVNSRVGGMIISNFCFDFLNPKYCAKNYLEEFISFPFKVINNPHVKNEEFDLNDFNIVKNRIISDIKSIKDNSKKFAIIDTLKEMDNTSPISYQISGYLEDLENITPKNLFKYYQKMLEHDYCDIMIIGDLDMKKVVKMIKERWHLNSIKKYSIDLSIAPARKNKVNVAFKKEEYSQANLVVGCNIIDMTKIEKYCVINVLNSILGGHNLDDKLSIYLRKDNSLCYSVASYIQKYDNILLIHAGIDKSKYKLAVKLIKKALREVQKGIITTKELNNAKKINITSLNSIVDNEAAIMNTYLFYSIDNLPLIEDRIALIKKITVKDIQTLAKKIKINTINLIAKGDL